jgi:hypothetical protein
MPYKTFLLTRSGPIATVTFNRPERLNPINEQVVRKLTAILGADAKGCSYLMGEAEEATIRTLTAYPSPDALPHWHQCRRRRR